MNIMIGLRSNGALNDLLRVLHDARDHGHDSLCDHDGAAKN